MIRILDILRYLIVLLIYGLGVLFLYGLIHALIRGNIKGVFGGVILVTLCFGAATDGLQRTRKLQASRKQPDLFGKSE